MRLWRQAWGGVSRAASQTGTPLTKMVIRREGVDGHKREAEGGSIPLAVREFLDELAEMIAEAILEDAGNAPGFPESECLANGENS